MKEDDLLYFEWTPKWEAGDKYKVCSHQSGVHHEDLESGVFCNDCGKLLGYSQKKYSTPKYVFARKSEPVIIGINKDEVNQILSSLKRKNI